MKQLTQKQLTSLANRVLAIPPYKEEFDNKYFRAVAKKMLIEMGEAVVREMLQDTSKD